MQRISIIGSRISITDISAAVKNMETLIDNIKGSVYVCLSNVHTVVTGRRNENLRNITNNSYMALPDGMPLVWLGRLMGEKGIGRCAGFDLMEELFRISAEKGYTNYFYGSTDETLQTLKTVLEEKYKGIRIAGMHSPPFRDLSIEEDNAIIDEINRLSPHIIWVGLGAPKQETWMSDHVDRIRASVLIGVGAAFNFHAGTVKRAPRWMQTMGMEWLYRLLKEPGRLWKRYAITNFLFVFYLVADLMRKVLKSFTKEKKRRTAAVKE